MNNLYYKPSGKFNPISFLYLALAIGIGAPLLALIYTYAILYIPIVYLNFLCLAGIAFGLGFVANFVIGFGKVRNKILAIVFGLIIGLAGIYASWIVWVGYHVNSSAFVELSYLDLLKNPNAFWSMVWEINEIGTWGIGRSGGSVSGMFLTVVWVIEALAMISFPMFFAYTKACEPYLENDDNWAEQTAIGPFEYIPNSGILEKQLETKNYEELIAMLPAENAGQGSHSVLTVYHGKNRSQSKEFYLSVKNMQHKLDKEGKSDFTERELINFIHISKDTGQQLFAKIAADAAVTEIKD
jgi:hypothetical protein